MSEWISVKERLPDYDGKFLCCYVFNKSKMRNAKMFIGCIDYCATVIEPHWQYVQIGGGICVTHWIPLPELPK